MVLAEEKGKRSQSLGNGQSVSVGLWDEHGCKQETFKFNWRLNFTEDVGLGFIINIRKNWGKVSKHKQIDTK
jgi:hypothetical protein